MAERLPHSRGWVGREAERTLLDDLFFVEKRPLVVIYGPGGIGKTTLASHFVRMRFGEECVRWVTLYDSRNPSDKLRQKLTNIDRPSNGDIPRIIVVDGAEEVSDGYLNEVLSEAQIRSGLPALVTTRSRGALQGAYYLELGGLASEETAFLISQLSRLDLSPADKRRFAAVVGNHPLAAELVAGLLRAGTTSTDRLLAELEGHLWTLSPPTGVSQDQLVQLVRPQILDATDMLVERLRQCPGDLFIISPRQFEELIAAVLRDMGWDAELTKATRDGGRDVLAYMQTELGRILCLVEAKRYRKDRPVGVEIVRSLFGTFCDSGANSALLVTTSTFTKDAHAFQRRHQYQLGLHDYAKVVEWINAFGNRRQ